MRRLAALAISLALAGCTAEVGDEIEDPPMAPAGTCGSDVPELDWESFGQGFVTTYCQACHASTSLDRHKAPIQVVFDTEEETLGWRKRILEVAASASPTMPPGGGPSDDEREWLAIWLGCAH